MGVSGSFFIYYVSFLSSLITSIILSCTLIIVVLILLFFAVRCYVSKRKQNNRPPIQANGERPKTVGFFHPYCNAGGGGERVLWCAVRAIHEKYPDTLCVIYTGDVSCTPQEIIDKAHERFNIRISQNVEFIYLLRRNLVEAWMYPYFTLLGQSLGSIVLGMEALTKFVPDIYIDTMGYAFTCPLFRYIGNCKVASYVHYPTISTDMLQRVANRRTEHNNASIIAGSFILSSGKLIYYRMFALMYGVVGRCNHAVMVNSSWTRNHILELWKLDAATFLVFPPCVVEDLLKLPLERAPTMTTDIVSVSQFRPEKDHKLQLSALKVLLETIGADGAKSVRLVLIGSCRNAEDEIRVAQLRLLCKELGVDSNVVFKLNVSYEELKQNLHQATIGIHSMWNEHFGIGIVESMAAGVVMVAHNSGGPKLDIVTDVDNIKTGYLATTPEEYAACMEEILQMEVKDRMKIQQAARASVSRFTDEIFSTSFMTMYNTFLKVDVSAN